MLPVGIGDEIRARRERAGLTQEALAALLGVHPDTVDDWEWGEGAPGPVESWRLAAILGLAEGMPSSGGLAAGGEESITIHLVPPGAGAALGSQPAPHGGGADLIPVPSHPDDPPPRPGPPAEGESRATAGVPGEDRQAGRTAAATPWVQGRFRRLLAAAVLALLVAVAASSGLAAYEQSRAAARAAAEARELRTTLVMLAGERDRLAARLAELGAALADSGLVVPGVPLTLDP